jgi:DNA-binding response OmpR family regulator
MTMSILIVEDDETLGRVLGRILSREGFTVGQAATAAQAIRLARQQLPAMALLDLCLPDGNGIDLALRLRAEFSDLPLILMTAYPLGAAEQRELAPTFAGVLIKPLDLAALREVIAGTRSRAAVNCRAVDARPPATQARVLNRLTQNELS